MMLKCEPRIRDIADAFQPVHTCGGRIQEPQIKGCIVAEILHNELIKVSALVQPQISGMVSDPAMVFGADQIEVFRLGVFLSFPDLLCVLRPQPRLEEIGVGFLAVFRKKRQIIF